MAVVIIGVGVVAIVDAQQAFVRSNTWSSHAAAAAFLANEIRELTRHMPRHDPVTGLYFDGNQLKGWGPEPGEVTVNDYDDIDDFDGVRFGEDGDHPGPINAFGDVIHELTPDGEIMTDSGGAPVPMRGWSQTVKVEKVHPFDTSTALANDFEEPASGDFPGRAVDAYPLRVIVTVEYRGPFDATPQEITRLTWIVP